MDDFLDKKDDSPAGGPHPHAGFETVTLVLEGEIGEMKQGDFQMMTAGSGIVHTETIDKPTRLRILQLWLNLRKENRWARPRVQDISLEHVPMVSGNGVQIKLYSGRLAGLTSPVQNYTPLIIADISIDPGINTLQDIPAGYNAFLYVLSGKVSVGERILKKDQVGWLDLYHDDVLSELELTAGEEGARFVLYAAKPTGDSIVSHGPFIAGSTEEISMLYSQYRQGKMKHIKTVDKSQRIVL
jgi:hypothetical protein